MEDFLPILPLCQAKMAVLLRLHTKHHKSENFSYPYLRDVINECPYLRDGINECPLLHSQIYLAHVISSKDCWISSIGSVMSSTVIQRTSGWEGLKQSSVLSIYLFKSKGLH